MVGAMGSQTMLSAIANHSQLIWLLRLQRARTRPGTTRCDGCYSRRQSAIAGGADAQPQCCLSRDGLLVRGSLPRTVAAEVLDPPIQHLHASLHQAPPPPPPHHSQQKSHPLGWLLRSTPHLLRRINTSTQPSCSQDHGWSINGQEFDLASCCFRRGLPPNYHRRCCVSQPSSRWIGVGPQRYGHQENLDPQVSPENCIGDRPLTLSRQLTVGKTSLESSCGQALGLLVLLRFTHYCAST